MSRPTVCEQIISAAEDVAYEHLLSTQWSTWHPWSFCYRHSQCSSSSPPTPPPTLDYIWDATAPYGSCVSISWSITRALRSRFANTPSLARYSTRVQTLARTSSTNPDRMTHCLTAILLDSCCIVLDFSFSFRPVIIPVGTYEDSMLQLAFDGTAAQTRLSYTQDRNGPSLNWRPLHRRCAERTFIPVSERESIDRIIVPMAMDTEIAANGVKVPRSKSIKLHAAFVSKPRTLPCVRLKGRYFATMARLKLDFKEQRMILQIPNHDWLSRPDNRVIVQELERLRMFESVNDSVAVVVLDLTEVSQSDMSDARLQILAHILKCFKMRKREFRDIVRSVNDVRLPIL